MGQNTPNSMVDFTTATRQVLRVVAVLGDDSCRSHGSTVITELDKCDEAVNTKEIKRLKVLEQRSKMVQPKAESECKLTVNIAATKLQILCKTFKHRSQARGRNEGPVRSPSDSLT